MGEDVSSSSSSSIQVAWGRPCFSARVFMSSVGEMGGDGREEEGWKEGRERERQ